MSALKRRKFLVRKDPIVFRGHNGQTVRIEVLAVTGPIAETALSAMIEVSGEIDLTVRNSVPTAWNALSAMRINVLVTNLRMISGTAFRFTARKGMVITKTKMISSLATSLRPKNKCSRWKAASICPI